MKISFLTACVMASFFVLPATANEPPTKNTEIKNAETVDAIKRSEFTRRQYAIFNTADKNYDGRVTHDEVLRLSHEQQKPKHVAAFKAMDANNNGYLSMDEIEAKHEEFTSKRIDRLAKNKESLLKRYDQDKNGTITSRELEAYFERASEDRRSKTAATAAKDMKSKDVDGSGSVSLDEYLDSKTISANQMTRRSYSKGTSLTRDPNGDKIITRSENEAFVAAFFEELDKNKDDELSAREQSNPVFKRATNLSTRTLYLSDRNTSVFVPK